MEANIFLILAAIAAYLSLRLLNIGKREHGLPPGPPTIPIVGNLLSFPKEYAYLK